MAPHLSFVAKQLGIMEILQKWRPQITGIRLQERSHDQTRRYHCTGTGTRLGRWWLWLISIFPRVVVKRQLMESSAYWFANRAYVKILSGGWSYWSEVYKWLDFVREGGATLVKPSPCKMFGQGKWQPQQIWYILKVTVYSMSYWSFI